MFYKLKQFLQRGKRGWADFDTSDFDNYIARVIKEGLQYLLKNQHGTPADLTEEQWNDILKKIIKTFDTAEKIIDIEKIYIPVEEWTTNKYAELQETAQRHNYLFKHGKHQVMTLNECEEFEAGFDLFKKYFFSFWD